MGQKIGFKDGFYGTGKSIELSDEFNKQTRPSKADLGIVDI